MAYVNTRIQSSRVQVSQPQAPQGWFRRAISTVRDALTGPAVSAQSAAIGPDSFQKKTLIHQNRPRQLEAMNNGRGADSSRGLRHINVPDKLLLNELDKMTNGDYDRFI